MKRIVVCASIIMYGLVAVIASDSSAAPTLCKADFTCPILGNISIDGNDFSNSDIAINGFWAVGGPWGLGGTAKVVQGKSRCSNTSGGSHGATGYPADMIGEFCWCQMQSWFFTETQALEYFGMWFFYNSLADTGICASMCAFTCAAGVLADATWRSLLCLPPPFRVCDLTTMIADGCPSGYYPCIGSGTGGDAAGNYTITCTE